jgi:hypothetical protein
MTNKERYANNFVLNFLESTAWKIEYDLLLINVTFTDVVSNVGVTYCLLSYCVLD